MEHRQIFAPFRSTRWQYNDRYCHQESPGSCCPSFIQPLWTGCCAHRSPTCQHQHRHNNTKRTSGYTQRRSRDCVPICPLKRRSARLTDVTVRRQPPIVNAVRINPRVAKTKTGARRQRDRARMADYSRKQSLCEMLFFSITNVELHKCMPQNDCFHQFTEEICLELQAETDRNKISQAQKRQDKVNVKEAIIHIDRTLNTISTYIKKWKNKLIYFVY